MNAETHKCVTWQRLVSDISHLIDCNSLSLYLRHINRDISLTCQHAKHNHCLIKGPCTPQTSGNVNRRGLCETKADSNYTDNTFCFIWQLVVHQCQNTSVFTGRAALQVWRVAAAGEKLYVILMSPSCRSKPAWRSLRFAQDVRKDIHAALFNETKVAHPANFRSGKKHWRHHIRRLVSWRSQHEVMGLILKDSQRMHEVI